MSIKERNNRAKQYILDQISTVSQMNENDFESLPSYNLIKTTAEKLINVKSMGFRGVVATALTGKFLNKGYDYLNDFYACNPRSIFENGIYNAFVELKIPCGKSDPLNVAKNISVLDENWAKGKRPAETAMAAVTLLRIIDNEKNEITRKKIINYFFYRLFSYASECGSIVVHSLDEKNLSNQVVATKLTRFVLDYPESGTIPQFVISKLLSSLYSGSMYRVEGGDESVFGTNTTSKKPADLWIESEKGFLNLYEITVKKIDFKRLDDSIESLNATLALENPIIFICRIPEDIATLEGFQDGTLTYRGKTFNFVDISEFIRVTISLLSAENIECLLKSIKEFIGSYLRPVKTKEGWNKIFS